MRAENHLLRFNNVEITGDFDKCNDGVVVYNKSLNRVGTRENGKKEARECKHRLYML